MIKQLLLPLIGVAAFIIFVGVLVKNPEKLGFTANQNSKLTTQKEIKVDNKTVKVAITDTPEERAKGLSGITFLGEQEGMLFIFESKDVKPSFWMKGMVIPLDIIWINDGKIVQIDKNIEAPKKGTPDSELKNYKTSSVVDYVLEVNAGFSDKNGVKEGDEMQFDL